MKVAHTKRGKPAVGCFRKSGTEGVTARRTEPTSGSSSGKKRRPFCNGTDRVKVARPERVLTSFVVPEGERLESKAKLEEARDG